MPQTAHRWIAFWIVIITAATFSRLFSAEFVMWDDPHTLAANPRMLPPTWRSVGHYWQLFPPAQRQEMRIINHEAGLWIPLTYSLWSGVSMFAQIGDGMMAPRELNPYVFHAFNIAVHAAAAVTVYLLLLRLGFVTATAAAGALIFAVHPIQVESVAWISGLKDLLAGALSLVAIGFYLLHAEESRTGAARRAYWWASLAALLSAMLCKPSAVATPLIILILDTLILRRRAQQILLALAPLAIATIPIMLIARLSQHGGLFATPLWLRPLVATDAIALYLAKLVLPVNLAIDHGRSPLHLIESGALYWTWIVPAAIGTIFMIIAMRGERRPLAGLLVFVAALLPVLGLVPFSYQFYSTTAEHYAYLAMFGVAIGAAVAVQRLPARLRRPVVGAAIAALAFTSLVQTGAWKDSEALFTHAVSANPNSVVANNNLASLRRDAGDPSSAVVHYRRALQTNPNTPYALANLWETYLSMGDADRARSAFVDDIRARWRLPPQVTARDWRQPAAFAAALLARGSNAEARSAAQGVLGRHPNDPLAAKVLALCDLIEASGLRPPTTSTTQ